MSAAHILVPFVAGVLLILIGAVIPGLVCLFGVYPLLCMYNRVNGRGVPTFTYEDYKREQREN